MSMNRLTCLLAAATAFLPMAAFAQAGVVPKYPMQFERVHLRLTADSCQFAEDTVSVEMNAEKTLIVRHRPRQCLVPGFPKVVDIQLGAFPAGSYEALFFDGDSREAAARVKFVVNSVASVTMVQGTILPIADYSGLWGVADEPGWGLSVHQGTLGALFGALFIYDAQREPQWYSLQSGGWTSTSQWDGQVIRSDGPPWMAATYPADGTQYRAVGNVRLDFGMIPGQEDIARLTYSIDGQTVTKELTRLRF
ncbi:hypothetical protein [Tahibacter harae]|uniref:Uncharacterized protein n=1 Tax=Tahibacter harae TaxID=2963937 RepID=A0ABT1QUW8_9GAMM|nr:hypothetical protein [Tahibacter harae]MCQ4166061.1 hypothetical protein [Tahibacter harae]